MLFSFKPDKYKQDLVECQRQAHINFLNYNLLDMRKEFTRLGLSVNEANNLLLLIKQTEQTMIQARLTKHKFDLYGAELVLNANGLLQITIQHSGNIEL